MSTNVYLLSDWSTEDGERPPEDHVGKRYGAGNGEVGFIWAMHPEDGLRRVFAARGAETEFGQILSFHDFVELLRGCVVQDDTHVGTVFR